MAGDWIIADTEMRPEDWDAIYEFAADQGVTGWYVVADGSFTIRPDLYGEKITGSLMRRDHAEYGNTTGDIIRVLTKRGIKAYEVTI
jgi:hypothetical protein